MAITELTSHTFSAIVERGNAAIRTAVEGHTVLVPEEGGWLEFEKVAAGTVKCVDAVVDLVDLEKQLQTGTFTAFLYQNPGGYFASQPMEEIYALCKKYSCVVILDASGAFGTALCDGKYADIIVGSFGRWKLVNAEVGGFMSCNDEELFEKLKMNELVDEVSVVKIQNALEKLPERVTFLKEKVQKIKQDLKEFDIVHKDDYSLVVVVRYADEETKQKVVSYCRENGLPYRECPRYIRLNSPAISIEVKQLG